MNKEINW